MSDLGSEDDCSWTVIVPRCRETRKGPKQKSTSQVNRRKETRGAKRDSVDDVQTLGTAVERAFEGLGEDSKSKLIAAKQGGFQAKEQISLNSGVDFSFRRFCILSWRALHGHDSPSPLFRFENANFGKRFNGYLYVHSEDYGMTEILASGIAYCSALLETSKLKGLSLK